VVDRDAMTGSSPRAGQYEKSLLLPFLFSNEGRLEMHGKLQCIKRVGEDGMRYTESTLNSGVGIRNLRCVI